MSAGAILASPNAALPFLLVADENCTNETLVGDLGDRTLLISSTNARVVQPERPIEDGVDISAGLPAERGKSTLFVSNPLLLGVNHPIDASLPNSIQPREIDVDFYLHVQGRFVQLSREFGRLPVAAPVESGTVIVGWADDPQRGDPEGVPIGNLTIASLVTVDGKITTLSNWPRVLTWDQRGAARTIWAFAARPRQPGKFVLRVPLAGRAQFFPIPGTVGCRGLERTTRLATYDQVTDESIRVLLEPYADCVAKGAPGVYRLDAKSGHWTREGDSPPWHRPEPNGLRVTARGVEFELVDGAVLLRRADQMERVALDVRAPQPNNIEPRSSVVVTAGGRDLWVHTRVQERCKLYRYQWRQ